MAYRVLVEPASEPVSRAEALSQLRLPTSVTDFDDTITRLIRAARNRVQADQWRQLITATRQQLYDGFPCGEFYLPFPPLQEITAFTYIDTAGNTQSLTAGVDYLLDDISEPARIFPMPNTSWPATACNRPNTVSITYTCGYGEAENVPDETREAILLLIENWFDNPAILTGTISKEVELGYRALVDTNSVKGFF